MSTTYGVYGDPEDYSFSVGGSFALIAPVDQPLPPVTTPVDETAIPSGYSSLGVFENGEVNVNLSQQTEDITTGVLPTTRRSIITGQSGLAEGVMQFYEPDKMVSAQGVAAATQTASTSLSRAFKSLVLGGTLGDLKTLLIVQSFDIELTIDSGLKTYEQVWIYTPRAQKDGDINLAQKVGRAPAINFRYKMLGFNYSNLTALARMLWLEAV